MHSNRLYFSLKIRPKKILPCSQGFSLVEMLVALSIFSIVLLSFNLKHFQNTQTINNIYFNQLSLNLLHNTYEQIESSTPTVAVDRLLRATSSILLPQGEGATFSDFEQLYIEVSWFDRVSKKRNTMSLVI